MAEATDLQNLLGLGNARGVQAQQRAGGADVCKAAAIDVKTARGFKLVGVVVVNRQAKAGAVQAQRHAARIHACGDAGARSQQAVDRRGKTQGARHTDQVRHVERTSARHGSALCGGGAVKGVGGAAHHQGACGSREVEQGGVGRTARGTQTLGKVQCERRGGEGNVAGTYHGQASHGALGPEPAAVVGHVLAAQPKQAQVGVGELQTRRAGAGGVQPQVTAGVFQAEGEHVHRFGPDHHIVGKADGGRAAQAQALAQGNAAREAEAAVVAEVVKVQPLAHAILQDLVVGRHGRAQGVDQLGGAGIQHMGLEVQAVGGGEQLKVNALAGIDQAAAAGKSAADAAIGEHIENLAVGGPVTIKQVDLDLAVQRSQSRDVDLVMKIRTSTCGVSGNLE